jgi:predicted enzyme related to lactoylglutathione lyase
MASRLVALCFDAREPEGVGRFWAAALGWEAVGEPDGVVGLRPTDGTRFGVRFLPGAAEKAPGQNRIHIDLTTSSWDDQSATVERLIELGGRHLDVGQGPDDLHVVLADPEGNELCVIEPTNNFLSDCPRLGAVNCDGSQTVGYFWSAALGWPLVWDKGEETAIRAPDGTGPMITWGGPPVAPKIGKNRLHLDIVPVTGSDQDDEVERLGALGAIRTGAAGEAGDRVVMTDPDGNEFCVLSSQ